jgi:hypothetical protein
VTNKFVSLLEHIGSKFNKGIVAILPFAETEGEEAVSLFVPALGPAYNSTVSAIALAEQKYAALGNSASGAAKMADVLTMVEPTVAQSLKDAGQASDTPAVITYIQKVVDVLKLAPAPSA